MAQELKFPGKTSPRRPNSTKPTEPRTPLDPAAAAAAVAGESTGSTSDEDDNDYSESGRGRVSGVRHGCQHQQHPGRHDQRLQRERTGQRERCAARIPAPAAPWTKATNENSESEHHGTKFRERHGEQRMVPAATSVRTMARIDDDDNTGDTEELMGEGVATGRWPEPDPIRERHGEQRTVQAATRDRTMARINDDDDMGDTVNNGIRDMQRFDSEQRANALRSDISGNHG